MFPTRFCTRWRTALLLMSIPTFPRTVCRYPLWNTENPGSSKAEDAEDCAMMRGVTIIATSASYVSGRIPSWRATPLTATAVISKMTQIRFLSTS